jgi:hydrophobin
MYFSTFVAALFAGLAVALPTVEERQVYVPCSGLYSNAQCCATDVLGVADLDCGNAPSPPTSGENFSALCAAMGQRARCCVLPIVSLCPLKPRRKLC